MMIRLKERPGEDQQNLLLMQCAVNEEVMSVLEHVFS